MPTPTETGWYWCKGATARLIEQVRADRKAFLADRDELGALRDVATAADDYMRWGSGELGGADEGLPYHQALSEALQRLKKATEPTSTPPKKEPNGEL